MPATATLGLSTYRWNNNLKSIALLLAFPALLLLLFGGIFYVYGLFAGSVSSRYLRETFDQFGLVSVLGTNTPLDFAASAVSMYWPIAFGVAALWVVIGYVFNGAIIRAATGAKPVTRQEAPQLYNLLENLCISRGLAMPGLYVIETEGMNAYASGIDERSYAVTVTRGLLDTLNDEELEAVLAHELTHIINRDCRLLIVTIVFVGMISFLSQLLWRILQSGPRGRSSSSSRSRDGGAGVILFMIIAAVALAVGYVLALILRLALSRRREYLADAGSVELTKNPDALISALVKLAQNPHVPDVASEVRQMFIENPPSKFDPRGLFGTHPPISDRIDVLEQLGGRPPQKGTALPWSSVGKAPARRFKSPWS